jgi:hypothetical protein
VHSHWRIEKHFNVDCHFLAGSIRGRATFFSARHSVHTDSGSPFCAAPTGVLSAVVKRPEREFTHSPHSSAKVNNTWCYVSTTVTRRFIARNRKNVKLLLCLTKNHVMQTAQTGLFFLSEGQCFAGSVPPFRKSRHGHFTLII